MKTNTVGYAKDTPVELIDKGITGKIVSTGKCGCLVEIPDKKHGEKWVYVAFDNLKIIETEG